MAYYQYHHLKNVYFRTGIVPTFDTVLEIDNAGFVSHNGGTWPGMITSEGPVVWGNSTVGISLTQSTPYVEIKFGNSEITGQRIPISYGTRYSFRLDKNGLLIDGTTLYSLSPTSMGTPVNEFVFGARNMVGTIGNYGDLYIGDLRIYQGGVLVAEYKPSEDGNGYTYYDTVSHTYLTKYGSGTIDPGPSADVFEPSQDSFSFNTQGGTASFAVTSDNAWTAATPTYFTMSPLSGSAGETTVTITAPERLTTRNETVTFTDSDTNTFDITIAQSDGNITPNLTMYRGSTTIKKMYYGTDLVYRKMAHSPSLTLSVDNLAIDPNGGSGTFTVTTDGRFTVSTDDSWITLSTSGTTVTVTATATQDNRSGSVLVTATNGFVTKTATVAVSQSVVQLVSYIHTTSTTWNKDYVIDTGIIADPTTTMRVKYLGKGVGSDRVIGYDWMDTGVYEVGWRFFDVFSNTNTLDINNKRYQYGSPMKNNNTVYDITTGNAFIYDNINETYVINQTAESSLAQPHSILVDVGTRYVAEVEIVQNGTTVFFGKAAVDDNIIGLYDTVSGTMKYNPNLTMTYEPL